MQDTDRRKVKSALEADRFVIGSFVTIGAPALAEVMGLAGFDFLVIDAEHGPLSIETAENLVRAAELAGTAPLVRVAENNPAAITRALDIGAHGVQVPHITTADQARRAVQAAKYYPGGSRGVAMMRSAQYSAVQPSTYFARANAETMVVLQCETAAAVENLPEILEVEGIDVIFVGPYDLSQSLGTPGQVNKPEVQDMIGRALDTIIASGVAAGTVALSPAHARLLIQKGVRYLTLGADYLLLLDRCRNDLIEARKPEGEKPH